jgi:hypothetical protein
MGNDENQEEVVLKVIDRRKFNSDGSVKEGVKLEPATEPKPAAPPAAPLERSGSETPATLPTEAMESNFSSDDVPSLMADPIEGEEDDEIPGADDPASFVNFLSTLATNAAAALGAVPHPATGKRSLDLDTGKYWLDVLAMVKEKTKGNLHDQEQRLLDGLLADLRMQYVTMVRATEEKLKAQAAQKFSGADILGKK